MSTDNLGHRRFPHFFVQQLLPQLFFSDPSSFLEQVSEVNLRAMWLEGNRQLAEKTPPDGLTSEQVPWGSSTACLVKLPRPQHPGEAFAALLLATEPAIFCLEKMMSEGFALTRIGSDGSHHFLQQLTSSDLNAFLNRCREQSL